MTLDKNQAEIVAAAAEFIARTCPFTGIPDAEALRSILPKPRFYADGRDVWERVAGGELCKLHFVDRECCPDDATAALIAWDFADALNKRLGEEAS